MVLDLKLEGSDMRKLLFLVLVCFSFSLSMLAQEEAPKVTWKFEQAKGEDGTVVFTATATIAAGWQMYSTQSLEGVFPTQFDFKESADYELVGGIVEPIEPKEKFDDVFDVNVYYFEGKAVFKQVIKPLTDKPFAIEGEIAYQTCSGDTCLMNDSEFSVSVE